MSCTRFVMRYDDVNALLSLDALPKLIFMTVSDVWSRGRTF